MKNDDLETLLSTVETLMTCRANVSLGQARGVPQSMLEEARQTTRKAETMVEQAAVLLAEKVALREHREAREREAEKRKRELLEGDGG